jgi:5-methylcytosine-specific restriction endonuclease McrA
MRDFIIYHSAKKRGFPIRGNTSLQIVTKRSVNDLVGQRVWLVTGEGTPCRFFLASMFIVDRIDRNQSLKYPNQAYGTNGRTFDPIVLIEEEPWFEDFKSYNGDFAFGLKEITSKQEFVRELLATVQNYDEEANLRTPTADLTELQRRVASLRKKKILQMPKGQDAPPSVPTNGKGFLRDPMVKAWVLQEADGHCEACGNLAPFMEDDGEQYLEVHHVRSLASGGSDKPSNAIALCPNCHRRCHYGSDRKKFTKGLYQRMCRLVPE